MAHPAEIAVGGLDLPAGGDNRLDRRPADLEALFHERKG
jgi:hypothetical protein